MAVATYSERLAWLITANADQAIGAFQNVGKAADKDLGKAENRLDKLGGQLTKFGAGALAVTGVAAVGLYKLGSAADDLNAAISANEQVLGDASAATVKWADDSVRAVGLSKRAAVDATTAFGSIAKAGGLAGEAVSGFAIEQTKLAADMAAFKNVKPEEALRDLQAGYAGSTEVLRKYNIYVDDATLKQAYFRETGEKVTGTLTGQQKIIAIHSEVLRQSADIQGQWNREIDSAAAQQAMFSASLENLKAGIGQGVLPVMSTLLGGLNSVVRTFNEMPDPVKTAAGGVLAFGTAALGAGGAISIVAGQVLKMKDTFIDSATGALTGVGKFAAGAAIAATAVAGTVAIIDALTADEREIKARADEVAIALVSQTNETWKLAAASGAASGEVDGLAVANSALSKALTTSGDDGHKLTTSLGQLNLTADDALDTLIAFKQDPVAAMRSIGLQMGLTATEAQKLAEKVDYAEDPFWGVSEVNRWLTPQLIATGKAMEEVQDQAEKTDLNKITLEYINTAAASNEASSALVQQAEAQLGVSRADDPIAVWQKMNELLGQMTEEQRNAVLGIKGLTQAEIDAAKAAEDDTEAKQKAAEASKRRADAVRDELKALDELYDRERSAIDRKYAFRKSQDQLAEATDNLNKVMGDSKSKQEDVKRATDSAADAAIKASEDYATLNGASLTSAAGVQRQIESLEGFKNTLAPDSPLRKFLDEYIADLRNIPPNIATTLQLKISQGQVGSKDPNLAGTNPGFNAGKDGPQYRGATGAIVTRPTRALIGEAGPEAVIPLDQAPGASSVDDLLAMIGGKIERGEVKITQHIDRRQIINYRNSDQTPATVTALVNKWNERNGYGTNWNLIN